MRVCVCLSVYKDACMHAYQHIYLTQYIYTHIHMHTHAYTGIARSYRTFLHSFHCNSFWRCCITTSTCTRRLYAGGLFYRCAHAYIHTCIHTYICVRWPVPDACMQGGYFTGVYMHTYMHTYMHACMHAYVYMDLLVCRGLFYRYVHIYICMYVCLYVCMRWLCVCTHSGNVVCVCVWMHTQIFQIASLHTRLHIKNTYIHTHVPMLRDARGDQNTIFGSSCLLLLLTHTRLQLFDYFSHTHTRLHTTTSHTHYFSLDYFSHTRDCTWLYLHT